ncbi:MAG TPA: DUF1566 domain-containing protein [bacterium]|nr:DUF1566 domain-containing protein [bacterium]
MKKALLFLLALFLIVSCDALKLKDRGKEGEACFTDNTCKEPYECIEGKCVKKTAHDDDDIDESDDFIVETDEDVTDDRPDQTDASDKITTDDSSVISDEDVPDDQPDTVDSSDEATVDDVVEIADEDNADDQSEGTDSGDEPAGDDATITPDDMATDDAVIVADEDVTDDQPDAADELTGDDATIMPDDMVTDDAILITDDALVSDDDVVVATMEVICTGQTKCYNATQEMTCPTDGNDFYGQDAQYAAWGYCTPRDYTVSGTYPQEIVTDNVTGLIWQRTRPGMVYTWDDAVYSCGQAYGGYNDWRLPSRKELASLVDHGSSNPSVDLGVFPDTGSSFFWTSSSVASNSANAWRGYFYQGAIDNNVKTSTANIWCVRGPALPNSSFSEATVSGKVIVTDVVTGLIWTKEYSGDVSWQGALNYCETLNYGGVTDWRLPNIGELQTLVDDTSDNPASSFPEMPAAGFWSSSTDNATGNRAWLVAFDSGIVSNGSNKTASTHARCVRSEPVAPLNECVTQSNPCDDGGDTGGTCTDTETSYTCTCTDYYFQFFNGSCRDIDECLWIQLCNDNGDISATCTNISPGYDCGCSDGFEISYTYPASPEYPTCIDIDECATGTDNCSDHATCTDTDGSFGCACDPSYAGDGVHCSNVLCTGQTKCYDDSSELTCPTGGNDFYGQDAQYAGLGFCMPRDYTVSGGANNDVVTDNVTGLIWQRTLPATYNGCTGGAPAGTTCTWQEAVNYCGNLSYGGQDDWRLPTRRELATLPDYGRYNPAIDTAIFPGTQPNPYWSSSSYASYTDNAWCVYFYYGSESYSGKTNTYHVRCARGAALPGTAFTQSTVSGKVIVTDTVTGLQWTKEYASLVNWQAALAHCESQSYGGHTDWRLPNIEELKTLVDDTIYSPASTFPGMPSQYLWSSSSNAEGAGSALVLNFSDSYMYYDNKTNANYALCVR